MSDERTSVRVLVVDDDQRIRDMLREYFRYEGYDVACVVDGDEMKQALARRTFDIILLDLVFPGKSDGLQLARDIRATSDVPIIMLTGRDDVVDRVVGLEVGADDYIPKPFHLREVHARIKTVLRRRVVPFPPASGSDDLVAFGNWRLDRCARTLTDLQGRGVELTTGEFDMLDTLAKNAGRVLTREQLMEITRKRSLEAFDRTIDTQIARLRRKIEMDPAHPQLIKSVRGIGYCLAVKIG